MNCKLQTVGICFIVLLDPFYIVTNYIKWVKKTSWTYSTLGGSHALPHGDRKPGACSTTLDPEGGGGPADQTQPNSSKPNKK